MDEGRIDEIVEAAVEQGQAPGVVAAVAGATRRYVKAAGVMAVGGPPMRPDTLFRISSTTKPITAAVVLSLVEDGLLDLDGPVEELLPELAGRRVLRRPDGPLDDTVAGRTTGDRPRPAHLHLGLRHAGGDVHGGGAVADRDRGGRSVELASFGPPQPDTTPEPDTWMARLGELPLLAQPGERWLYQAGSQVLGVLAARAGGAPFEDVMRERVLGPLGMRDTAFHAADTSRLATAYERRDGQLAVTDPPDGQWSRPPRFPDGGGGLVATAGDLLAFGRMLIRGGAPVLTDGHGGGDDPRPADRGAAGQRLARLQLPRRPRLGLRRVRARRRGYTWEGGLGTAWSNVRRT